MKFDVSIQRNVAQQNAVTRADMLRTASAYRDKPQDSPWLTSCLVGRGLAPEAGLLVHLAHLPDQGGDQYYAIWLTNAGRFWRLDVLVPYGGASPEIADFSDVTATIDVDGHRRGTGATFGHLAMQVLEASLEIRR